MNQCRVASALMECDSRSEFPSEWRESLFSGAGEREVMLNLPTVDR